MKNTSWPGALQSAMVVTLLAVGLAQPQVQAQQAVAAKKPLAFDVATVKAEDPNMRSMTELRVYPGGRLVIHRFPLRRLISVAFQIPVWEITGGDKWVDTVLFDVEGKPSEEMRNEIPGGEYSNVGLHDVRVRSMLQTLLIERFQLKFHMDSASMPAAN